MKKIKSIMGKYLTFIKYFFSAGLSFLLDLTLFTIFSNIFKLGLGSYAIIVATISARIISSFVNYHINRNNVFKSAKDGSKIDRTSLLKYVCLVIVQMFISSFTVFGIYNLTKINETLIKIPVECIQFVVNYFIQKFFIFNQKKIKLPTWTHIIKILIFSILGSFAFVVELNTKTHITLPRHNTDFILYLLVGIGLYIFYKEKYKSVTRRGIFRFLSVIFTLLLIFGYSFDLTDSTKFVYGDNIFVLISIAKFFGFYPFINLILNVIYEKLISINVLQEKKNKIISFFNAHPFIFSFLAMFICFLPYIISYYPAIMGYDPANQIKEVLGIHTRYMDSVVLLDENVTITNFNPVLHTLLLGNCFKIGINIGNVNFGLFIYSFIQIILMLTVLSYSIHFLKKEGVPNKILFIILAIYCFVPIFPFYSLSTNKDTIFSLVFLLFVMNIYELIKHEFSFKSMIKLTIVGILLCLSRNNGIYTVLLTLPFCFLALKEKRKNILIAGITIFLAFTCYDKIILPHFKITPTSIREVLSIPFQQTAALIQKSENIISSEDKAIIAKIIDYDISKEKYDPELSDAVKNTFNRYYTDSDLKKYFNVWFKYLLKKPLIYIDATINNMYGYFYPDTSRWYLYTGYNNKLKEAGYDYHFNDLNWLRSILDGYGNAFQYIPILSALVNIGFTVWIYIYLIGALIVNKNKKFILLLAPALTLILVCIASPANAYFRYALPFIMSLPLTLALLYVNRKTDY